MLRNIHSLYVLLIGPAGCGKTTMSKRFVKTIIDNGGIAFFLSFHHLSNKYPWTLSQFLFKIPIIVHKGGEPSDHAIVDDFNWVVRNQDKCTLVLDGLDQSPFEISNPPPSNVTMNDILTPADIISLLLSRKFLPGIKIIVTSRPHSITNLQPRIQPDLTLFLNDLSKKDMITLIDHYLDIEDSQKFLEIVEQKSFRIYQLIYNPLFLRLFSMLYVEVGDSIWLYTSTTAKLYIELIKRLQCSSNYGNEDDIYDVSFKLERIAFDTTMNDSVVFEQKDLDRHNLTTNQVQDLVFSSLTTSIGENSSIVGSVLMYFNHQSIQVRFVQFNLICKKLFILIIEILYLIIIIIY